MNYKNNIPNAMVAVCPHRPFNCGHVGFGFEYPNGTWRVGAVEGSDWSQGNRFNGFWTKHVKNFDAAMNQFAYMRHLGAEYDRVKVMDMHPNVAPNPQFADKVTKWVSLQKYELAGRNCMDSAYDILLAFGLGYTRTFLPRPEDNWFPNDWYNKLPASHELVLQNVNVIQSSNTHNEPELAIECESLLPDWRDESSDQYIATRQGSEY